MNKKLKSIIIIFFLILLTLVIIKSAWVCDDAYITFRTVDNFANGHGLRWNVGERVQSFTSPLWMFLMTIYYIFTGEIYYTTIVVSIFLTLISVILLSRQYDLIWKILLIILLMNSKTFIDFSTSGLENPLVYLLLVIFLIMYTKSEFNCENLLKLSLISSLIVLTRIDLLVLVIPSLLYFIYKLYSKKNLLNIFKSLSLGFLPVIIWEIFSIFYYGFPLANTYYAKLNTMMSSTQLFKQGLFYLLDSFKLDVFLIVIIFGILLPYFIKNKRFIYLSHGILLYTFFVVKAGGDFMNGRFLLAQFIFSIFILFYYLNKLKLKKHYKLGIVIILILLILLTGFSYSQKNPIFSKLRYSDLSFSEHGIADERGYYYLSTNLIFSFQRDSVVDHIWAYEGQALRKGIKNLIVFSNIGFKGYYAGPNIRIIDQYALTDVLLARIDAEPGRPGHFIRKIPEGYPESISKNENLIKDENLSIYYDKIKLITTGDLFSFVRVKEIIKMNLGCYEYLINKK